MLRHICPATVSMAPISAIEKQLFMIKLTSAVLVRKTIRASMAWHVKRRGKEERCVNRLATWYFHGLLLIGSSITLDKCQQASFRRPNLACSAGIRPGEILATVNVVPSVREHNIREQRNLERVGSSPFHGRYIHICKFLEHDPLVCPFEYPTPPPRL